MKKLKSIRRKFIATILFSLIASLFSIVHGIFLDADITQLKRLSLEGFLLTFTIIFPTLLLLEWLFNLEDHEEFKIIEKRITKLEKEKVKIRKK